MKYISYLLYSSNSKCSFKTWSITIKIIEDNKLKYNIDLEEIYKVCYYNNTNKLVNIDKELGQI